jgi:hypothetical protein
MPKRIQSSEVLDANAETTQDIRGEIIGRYSPTGPNRWDDWELTTDDIGGIIEVPARNHVQVEPLGADPVIRFRWRQGRGSVLRVSWIPNDEDLSALATGQWGVQEAEQASFIEKLFNLGPENDPRDDMLEYFLKVLSTPYSPDPGIGWEAMLVKTLRGR